MEVRRLSPHPQREPFQISLRVRHPSIDPAAVSRELQLEPQHSFMAGQRRGSGAGASVHAESYWLGALNLASWSSVASPAQASVPWGGRGALAHEVTLVQEMLRPLSVALGACAAQLRRHRDFFRQILSDGGQVGLRVQLVPKAVRGFTLAPHVSRALCELGIELEFEFAER